MNCLENGFHEAGVVYGLTCTSKIKMRTSSIIERLNEEIRRDERVISIYPNEESIERLNGALQKEINDDWISRKYINMDLQRQITGIQYFTRNLNYTNNMDLTLTFTKRDQFEAFKPNAFTAASISLYEHILKFFSSNLLQQPRHFITKRPNRQFYAFKAPRKGEIPRLYKTPKIERFQILMKNLPKAQTT